MKNRFLGRKSDRRHAAIITRDARLAQLIVRFGLQPTDLADARIMRLLNFKVALDDEISQLLRSGAREASVRRFASLAGFAEKDFARDWPLINIVKSVQEAQQCVATLRPRSPKPAPDAKKVNTPTDKMEN
jgi:hypothetical protein